jgi:undecaprenyl pyrophosphate synthase
MTLFGREERELLNRLTVATEKNAEASSKLIELATEERAVEEEPVPPYCPNCQSIDPDIVQRSGGAGRLSEFVLVAQCGNCNKTLFALPSNWTVVKTPEEADAVRRAGNDKLT